ncbi:hypothetical protein A3C98_00295 [Candidatus Roizmanbacteria bacterium RIFCSPHIGHO2_02_FULL_37_15]|nr:MAG: hypothetical protein A2859_00940 [Candidatus Roizmanbacteria bacterium RIFCSPHIGHO2_01_FULL_37_16b]OGK21673.1 MAG: hypothetical protein A3C98_00295 [Candidatus Roizmanbacteria bacterium RIFCSPHIGHO2_02_FULL_37_15]OGK55631.1 MAG: hypothetical protein A3I50_04835 [Candidatus Roizmanbacteria bacterium RIFCSPLOWO2_02_FULL_37_9]
MIKADILKLLSDFISIQSVSTDSNRHGEILKTVDFLKNKLKTMGFEVKVIGKDDPSPLIIGIYHLGSRRDQAGKRQTIGIYGHYDVQPEDPVKEWKSPPFRLTTKDGRIYGRGVADNKGHVIQNLVSIKRLIETNKLTNNIVFILEGEEEIGSTNFEKYSLEAKDILSKANVFYLTDTGMFRKNIPQIFYGLRGLVYFELTIETGTKDLHSGLWGNRVLNPPLVASQLFAKMKDDKTGRVLIPGFYDDVRTSSKRERGLLRAIARTDQGQIKEAGVYKMLSLDKKQPYLSAKIYPSLDINGFISGYTGEGLKTVIPSKATVKFSCRLVESQTPDKIEKLMNEFIAKNLPEGVKYDLKVLSKDHPFYTDIDNPYVKKTAEILANFFGNETRFNRSGGSIAAAEVLQKLFQKPVILTGFTLPDDSIHSANENFNEEMFFKGIEVLEIIYSQVV